MITLHTIYSMLQEEYNEPTLIRLKPKFKEEVQKAITHDQQTNKGRWTRTYNNYYKLLTQERINKITRTARINAIKQSRQIPVATTKEERQLYQKLYEVYVEYYTNNKL